MKCTLHFDVKREPVLSAEVHRQVKSKDDCQLLKKALLQYVNVEIRGKDESSPIQAKALIDSVTWYGNSSDQ